MRTNALILLLCLSATGIAGTARHVVATGGVTSGNALDSATGWTFAWSGKGQTVVQPGDTIWLHGGVHLGGAEMEMIGTASAPIIYRNWQNQRVQIVAPTVDGVADECIWAKGKHNWFWGLEIWNSDSTGGPWESGGGITFVGDSNKAINCILHNLLDVGIRDQSQPSGTEVTGCIFYYNGRQSLHDNQGGYAFYTQQTSAAPKKLYQDNIYWGQWGTGGQVYGTDVVNLSNITWTGNVAFNNGNLRGHETDFSGAEKFMPQLIFGNTEATGNITNDTLTHNYTFCSTIPAIYHYANIGYNGGASSGIRLDSNLLVGDDIALWLKAGTTGFSMTGNTIIGPVNPSNMSSTFPNNRYLETRSSGWTDTVIVRRNPYESKRANVTIYNLDGSATVSIDPSGILSSGDAYRIVSATNYYGNTLASGTWTSGSITITMADITLDRYIEDNEAGHTTYAPRNPAPYFASLVLLGSAGDGDQGRRPRLRFRIQ